MEKKRSYRFNLFKTVSSTEKAFIARQLSVMLDSGLPLLQAVNSLANQTNNHIVAESLTEVGNDLQNGFAFSDAVKKHPKIFNTLFVSVVAAGETSGQLDISLNLLADEMEKDNGFRSKVLGALLYPAFIIVAMIIVAIILTTRIVPALETVFAQSGVSLPWTTKLIISITNSLIAYWYLYILAVAVVVVTAIQVNRNDDGRRAINNITMHLPVIGSVLVNLEMSRFTRIFGILVKSGVPIIQAINSVASVLDSIIYRDILRNLAYQVERGAPIAQTLAKYPDFPSAVTEMIAVGEHTGKLSEVLSKLADFYEASTDQATKNLAAVIEPAVFVVVGLGVAFLVFSIIVPIYSLSNVI